MGLLKLLTRKSRVSNIRALLKVAKSRQAFWAKAARRARRGR